MPTFGSPLSFDTTASYGNSIAALLAQALASPGTAQASLKKAVGAANRARLVAARRTMATLQKIMKKSIQSGSTGVPRPARYSNWLGIGQDVPVGALIKANRPKSGGRKFISAPTDMRRAEIPLYRLGTFMRWFVDRQDASDFYAKVGMLREYGATQANEIVWRKIQEGGFWSGDKKGSGSAVSESSRRYLGALGMPIRRGTQFNTPKRDIIRILERKNNPDSMFQAKILDELNK